MDLIYKIDLNINNKWEIIVLVAKIMILLNIFQ